MNHFIYNGKILKDGSPVAGAGNRGLRYGDGVFETMKMLDGKLQLENEHFARLWKGMVTLGFDIPKHFSPEQLSTLLLTLAQKNGHAAAARVRLQVFRGDGGLYDAASHHPHYTIQTWALPEGNGQLNSNGLLVGFYRDAVKSCDTLANLKHNNFLPYVMAALHAKKEKWNDALLLNSSGHVCDSTIANLFIVKNEQVFTPALNQGCVAGVMRRQVIHQLKDGPLAVTERAISPEEILQADEVFLTNSIQYIRWVKSIENAAYGNSTIQKIYAALLPTIA